MRTSALIGLTLGIALVMPSAVLGFGTVNHAHQASEHEQITRLALGCDVTPAVPSCLEPGSLGELAGKTNVWGGVGAPDNPAWGMVSTAAAHCDEGDYLNLPAYPRAEREAQQALLDCRNWMDRYLNAAVDDAGAILKDGKIDDSQIPTRIACVFDGRRGRAKCNVFEDFGKTLHAAQDFYSHSNWVDDASASPPGLDLANPPGLGNTARAPWLDLRNASPRFPAGLMTGCYVFSIKDLSGARGCPNRVTHAVLNKDLGRIGPVIGDPGTARGRMADNFRRAVRAAIDDTRDKWAILRERIMARYGSQTGALILCGLSQHDPAKTCR